MLVMLMHMTHEMLLTTVYLSSEITQSQENVYLEIGLESYSTHCQLS